jgi:hypothetical protein
MRLTRNRRLAFPLLAIFVGTVSCHNSVQPSVQPGECGQTTVLEISSGTTPVFSWAPSCRIGEVRVEKVAGQRQQLWMVFDSWNGISSAVVYGSSNGPAPALEVGTTYRATIGVVVGGDATYTIAAKDFSP